MEILLAKGRAGRLWPMFSRRDLAAFLLAEWGGQKDRLFLWSPVLLALGIGAYFSLRFEPPSYAAAALLVPAGLHFLARRNPHLRLLNLALLIFLAGFVSSQLRTHLAGTPMLGREMDPVRLQARITGIEVLEPGQGVRLMLDRLEIEKLEPRETPHNIRLKLKKNFEALRPGDHITLLAGLNPPSPPVAPGAFDFQRHAFFKGIGAVGFIYKIYEVRPAAGTGGMDGFMENLRQNMGERIRAATAYPQSSVISALMTGERGEMSEEIWDTLRLSGLAHMISISGLHIGLVGGFFFFLLRFGMALFPAFALRHPIKKYSALIAIAALTLYVALVGFSAPTVRSLLTTGMVMVAIMMDRSPFSLRLVAFAALMVLLLAPENLLSASFQMSFAAVTGLVCFFEAMRPVWTRWRRQAGWFRKGALYLLGIILTSVIATVFTAPFSIFHFQQLSVYGVIANLLAIPVLSVTVMPAILLSYFALPLHLEFIPLAVADYGTRAVLAIAAWTASLSGSDIMVRTWPVGALALIVLGTLLTLLWAGRLRWLGLVPVAAAIVWILMARMPDILVAPEGKLAAVRDEGGDYLLATRRAERYAGEQWLQLNAQREAATWPREGIAGPLICGAEGCRMERDGVKVSFLRDSYIAAQECAWADLVVSPQPLERGLCGGKQSIDKFDVWNHGAHAVWIAEGAAVIRTVDGARGDRPWTASAK